MKAPLFAWLPKSARSATRRLLRDRRGVIAPAYAVIFLTLMMALGAGIDISNGLQVKYQLDLAADAAAVACGETWQSYMEAGAGVTNNSTDFVQLQKNANAAAAAAAQNAFLAQAGLLAIQGAGNPSFSNPTILTTGSPNIGVAEDSASPQVGTVAAYTSAPNVANCTTTYTASNLNYLMQIAGFRALAVQGQSSTQVELAPYVNVYLILDTSASMMVGSTPTDQGKIANYVFGHPAILSAGGGTNPCAFACHEDTPGTPFLVSHMQEGEQNAWNAGATTRFDVMRRALVNDPSPNLPSGVTRYCAEPTGTYTTQVVCDSTQQEGLLTYIRDHYFVTNARGTLKTFAYSMYGFNSGINGNEPPTTLFKPDVPDNSQYAVSTTTNIGNTPGGIAYGVNQLTIGLNTHLMPPVKAGSKNSNSVMQELENIVGTTSTTDKTPPGMTADNPLKFVIIITDGMGSDRNWNWCAPPGNAGCDNDPYPSPTTYPMLTYTTDIGTYCNLWTAASSTFNGQTIYTGTAGQGECADLNYKVGFTWPTTSANGSSSQELAPSKSGTWKYYYASPLDTDANPSPYNAKSPSPFNNVKRAQSFCSNIKYNAGKSGLGTTDGVTIAVLETPYVPLTGQQPNIYPYETGVQVIIYPAGDPVTHPYNPKTGVPAAYKPGPNGEQMSALSQALYECSTRDTPYNYYFQATSDAAIATGFIQLFNTYVAQLVHITQ